MGIIKRHFALMLALLALAGAGRAQDVQVVASVSDATIGTEETISYSIEVRGSAVSGVRTPDAPQTEGLVLAQRFPSTSRNVSLINGVVSQSVSFTWIFRPVQEGSAQFAPATVAVGDRSYETESIEITVVPQADRPQRRAQPSRDPFAPFRNPGAATQQAAPPEPTSEDLFIRVVPSKQSAIRGEQVTLRYDLYFREGIQLRQSRLTDSWDAEGFWREDLDVDARPVPRVVVENGLRYNMITLKRAAVFPARAGNLTVDPLKIESEAVLPVRTRDPFADFFSLRSRFTPVELASPPINLTVDPLPEAPPGFSGAVGRFDVTAFWDRTSVDVGESVQLTVTVRGSGNLATLAPPEFEPPSAFERYEPQIALDLDRSGNQLRGSKIFTFVLVPRANGVFEMPGVALTYFDTSERSFKTASTAPSSISVSGSSGSVVRATAGGLPVDDIAGTIASSGDWYRLSPTPLHRNPWAYAAIGGPALAFLMLMFVERRRQFDEFNPSVARHRRSGKLARKYLKEADQNLEQDEPTAFYESLERSVLGFIGNRLNVAEQGLTRERLDGSLDDAGVSVEVRQTVLTFLDACDQGRFAPIAHSHDEMMDSRNRAADLLVHLDSAL